MKRKVVLGLCVFGALVALIIPVSDQIVHFIIAGRVPFTNISIPPLGMLVFWIVAVPLSIAVYRLGTDGLWRMIETIGTLSQRHINRRIRWTPTHDTTLLHLCTSVALYAVSQTLANTPSAPDLTMRRRFLALPSWSN